MSEQAYIFIIIVAIVLFFAISYFWYRFIFSMKRQLWNQKQTLLILIKIAEKSGAITSNESGDLVKKMNADDQYL